MCLLLMHSQFYQLAETIVFSRYCIRFEKHDTVSWINCKIVANQPPCEMDITPRKRTKMVTLHEHTPKTYREIAALVCVSLVAVSRVIKLKQDIGSVSPKRKRSEKCGRKKKTTPRDDAVAYSDKVKKIPTKRATHWIGIWRRRVYKSVPLQQGFPTFLRSRTAWTPRTVNACHFFQNN